MGARMTPFRLAFAGAFACAAKIAAACSFHSYMPAETMIEKLLSSDHIVLARQDPDDPFRFKAATAIEGGLDHVELPHLVDSMSRRKLAANPGDRVLFARDGAYGPWQRLAYVDADLSAVLDRVVPQLDAWAFGADLERFGLFAGYVDHPNPRIRTLALRELDRADYAVLRELNLRPDADALMARLDLPSDAEFVPIRVLLLGFTGSPVAEAELVRRLEQAVSLDSTILGAYATALIEVAGTAGVRLIADRYLVDETVPLTAREKLMEALALQAVTGPAETRSAVAAAMPSLLEMSPALAAPAARQFGAQGDWSQAKTLEALMRRGALRQSADVITVYQYLAVAAQVSTDGAAN
jgi:hypothetical protein